MNLSPFSLEVDRVGMKRRPGVTAVSAAGLGFEYRVFKKYNLIFYALKDLIFDRDFTFRLMVPKKRLAVLGQGERDDVC
jgi:hypothetical protein